MYKYLCIGISSITHTGDQNKYKFDMYKYKYVYKFVICDDMNKKKNINDFIKKYGKKV